MKKDNQTFIDRSSSSHASLIANCRCSVYFTPVLLEGDKDIAPQIQELIVPGDWIYFAYMIKSLFIPEMAQIQVYFSTWWFVAK